jgi:hypothetical protein
MKQLSARYLFEKEYVRNGKQDKVCICLDIDYTNKNVSIHSKDNGIDLFKFHEGKHEDMEMWMAVSLVIQEAIEFGQKIHY